jgi:hypothetical protein
MRDTSRLRATADLPPLRLPQPRHADALAALDELMCLLGGDPDSGTLMPDHSEAFAVIVPLVESLLDEEPDEIPPRMLALLVAISLLPALPEMIAIQIAFGRKVGEQEAMKMWRLMAQARQRQLTVDEYVAQLHASGKVPRDTLVRLFHGEARRTPDEGRIRRGVTILRRAVGLVPAPVRPDLLCTLGWLQWAHGKRVVAAAYLAEAARIRPDHVLTRGLGAVIATKVPVWLTDPGPVTPTDRTRT